MTRPNVRVFFYGFHRFSECIRSIWPFTFRVLRRMIHPSFETFVYAELSTDRETGEPKPPTELLLVNGVNPQA